MDCDIGNMDLGFDFCPEDILAGDQELAGIAQVRFMIRLHLSFMCFYVDNDLFTGFA